MATCTPSLKAYVPNCAETISIIPDSIADGTYGIRVTDNRFGICNHYWLEGTATGGTLTFDATGLPAGLLTPYSGTFRLEIFDELGGCVCVKPSFCNTEYASILLKVRNVTGDDTAEIKCCEPCTDYSDDFSDDFCN